MPFRTYRAQSALQLSNFLDEERTHVKEGLVLPKEDDFSANRSVSISAEACEVCAWRAAAGE